MKKIRNIFCWKSLKEWILAYEEGYVCVKEYNRDIHDFFSCNQLLWMAENNCYPRSILCLKRNETYYILLTCEETDLFQFLSGKIRLELNGKNRYFSEIPAEQKRKIMGAQVNSVWIDADDDFLSQF